MKNILNLKENALHSNGISKNELFALLCIIFDVDIGKGFTEAIKNGHSTRFGPQNSSGFAITQDGIQVVEQVDAMCSIEKKTEDDILQIARKLKDVYLKGKKPGTIYYWSDSPAIIAKRLNTFFKKYGEDYSEGQIINATKRYLDSFHGDYTKARLLKYFIWKDEHGAGGDVESTSDLLNYIENEDDDNFIIDDSMDDLR